jgi:hypothetical protein
MGAGGLEPPQRCRLRILSPGLAPSQQRSYEVVA